SPIWVCTEQYMLRGFRVACSAATSFAIIDAAAVCEVAPWLVWTPTGKSPKTAMIQKPATPSATVTSTSENAAILQFQGLMAGKRESRQSSEQFVLLHGFPYPDRSVASG